MYEHISCPPWAHFAGWPCAPHWLWYHPCSTPAGWPLRGLEPCVGGRWGSLFCTHSFNAFSLRSTDVLSLPPLSIKKRFDFKQLIFKTMLFLWQHVYPGLDVGQMTAGRNSAKTALIYQISWHSSHPSFYRGLPTHSGDQRHPRVNWWVSPQLLPGFLLLHNPRTLWQTGNGLFWICCSLKCWRRQEKQDFWTDDERLSVKRASVSPVVVEMYREYSHWFGLCRDHFQAVSSQEVEHANLPINAAGQHAKEDESQRSNLPAGKSAAIFATVTLSG